MNRWSKLVISLGITALSLWWTFKDTTFEAFIAPLRGASWGPTLAKYLAVLAVIHLARTLRWGNLLSPLEKVPFRALNEASAIGFMMLLILPFRLGEFARPVLISQRTKIRRSAAMTSVVLERIIDGLVITFLLFTLMLFLPDDARGLTAIRTGAWLMLSIFGGGFVFLLLARWRHDLVVSLMRKTAGRLAPGLTEKVIGVTDGFVGALRQLPDASNLAQFAAWTAVYWAVNGYGLKIFAEGFTCANAVAECRPLELTVFQAFFVLCVWIVGLLIPAAPGSAGTAQAAAIIGLSVFFDDQLVKTTGLAFANAVWLMQIAQQVGLGLVFLLVSHGSFSDLAGKLSAEQRATQESGGRG